MQIINKIPPPKNISGGVFDTLYIELAFILYVFVVYTKLKNIL